MAVRVIVFALRVFSCVFRPFLEVFLNYLEIFWGSRVRFLDWLAELLKPLHMTLVWCRYCKNWPSNGHLKTQKSLKFWGFSWITFLWSIAAKSWHCQYCRAPSYASFDVCNVGIMLWFPRNVTEVCVLQFMGLTKVGISPKGVRELSWNFAKLLNACSWGRWTIFSRSKIQDGRHGGHLGWHFLDPWNFFCTRFVQFPIKNKKIWFCGQNFGGEKLRKMLGFFTKIFFPKITPEGPKDHNKRVWWWCEW